MEPSLSNPEESSLTLLEEQPPQPQPDLPQEQEASPPEPPSSEVEASPEPEPPASSEPDPEWSSLGDVDVAVLPEEVRKHVSRILDLATKERESLAQGFDAARSTFNDTLKRIQSAEDPERALGEEYLTLKAQHDDLVAHTDQLAEQGAKTTWTLFGRLHPELEVLPVETRELFAENIEKRLHMFEGSTQIERLEKALDYAKWSTNLPIDAGRPREDVAVSRRQVAVATGRTPPAQSAPDIDAMSVDEVLGQYMHILEGA